MSDAIVHRTTETPNPDSPMKPSCRTFTGGARSLPQILFKRMAQINSQGFKTFDVPIISTSRTPISRWLLDLHHVSPLTDDPDPHRDFETCDVSVLMTLRIPISRVSISRWLNLVPLLFNLMAVG